MIHGTSTHTQRFAITRIHIFVSHFYPHAVTLPSLFPPSSMFRLPTVNPPPPLRAMRVRLVVVVMLFPVVRRFVSFCFVLFCYSRATGRTDERVVQCCKALLTVLR